MGRTGRILTLALLAAACSPALARQAPTSATDPRVALSKTGEPHRRLEALVGTWSFKGKHVFPGVAKPVEFEGTLVRRPMYDGRYFVAETTGGEFPMPWSNGKPVAYRDMTIEGYDNVKRKYVDAVMHNEVDTGIITLEGDFDPATSTITYEGDTASHTHSDVAPGTKFHFRDALKFVDADHYTLVRRESVDGREIVTTELDFTRTKGA